MKPLKLPAVELPPGNIRYPSQWSDGDIEIYSQLPQAIFTPFEHHLKRCGWEQNSVAPTLYPADITVVNGSAYVHTDNGYGIMAITLIDSAGETELITRHGGTRGSVGDVIIFNTDEWHAWISHGPCALAGICVRRITPPTTEA